MFNNVTMVLPAIACNYYYYYMQLTHSQRLSFSPLCVQIAPRECCVSKPHPFLARQCCYVHSSLPKLVEMQHATHIQTLLLIWLRFAVIQYKSRRLTSSQRFVQFIKQVIYSLAHIFEICIINPPEKLNLTLK